MIVDGSFRDAQYSDLVRDRRNCTLCHDLTNPGSIENGCFDSYHIGHWSRWQGNLASPLMVVGQDWGDTQYFATNEGLDAANNPTNKTLIALLESIGIFISQPGESTGHNLVFFTNAILCLKQGGLQG